MMSEGPTSVIQPSLQVIVQASASLRSTSQLLGSDAPLL